MNQELLNIAGAVITFILSVNLYFFKDVIKRLANIELELAKISSYNKLVDKHDEEIDELLERIHNIEGQLKTFNH